MIPIVHKSIVTVTRGWVHIVCHVCFALEESLIPDKTKTHCSAVANYDFLPTIAEMLNVSIKTKKSGASFLQSLMKGKKLSKNHFVIVGSYFGPALIMNDGWKLRYSNRKKNYELYNLREDPKEKYDVSLRFPKKTEDLKKIMLEQCNGSIENGIHN